MQKVQVKNKIILGLKTRTKNSNEMNPKMAKIGALWQNFFTNIIPTLESTTSLFYGVYTNYESDSMGEFDILVGVEEVSTSDEMSMVTLEEGTYLCFKAKGELPQAVIATWGEIWAYFSDEHCKDVRVYKTDFEKYISEDQAEIYIGVK